MFLFRFDSPSPQELDDNTDVDISITYTYKTVTDLATLSASLEPEHMTTPTLPPHLLPRRMLQ